MAGWGRGRVGHCLYLQHATTPTSPHVESGVLLHPPGHEQRQLLGGGEGGDRKGNS